MPEAVKVFCETKSLSAMRDIHRRILQTYRLDFPKYNKRIDTQRISRIFESLNVFVGKKIIYSKLDRDSKSRDIRRIVELLIDSKVILPCFHSEASLPPLLSQSDFSIFKLYFVDIGLLNSLSNLDLKTLDHSFKNQFSTKGVLCEQYVAQHLMGFFHPSQNPQLTYHLRDKSLQKAEIDFLFEKRGEIYPVEVKSSPKGHLKSLKYFCEKRKTKIAIKASLDPFSIDKDFVSKTKLVNLPLYAVEYLKDHIDDL